MNMRIKAGLLYILGFILATVVFIGCLHWLDSRGIISHPQFILDIIGEDEELSSYTVKANHCEEEIYEMFTNSSFLFH